MKRCSTLFLFWIFCSTSSASWANSFWSDAVTIGGVEIGHKSHNLDELLDTPLDFYMLSANITVAYKDYYLGTYVSQSIAETDISEDGEVGEAERSDLDVVLGWNVRDDVTLFAGYKKGETELDLLTREEEGEIGDVQIPYNSSFEESGPYLGAAYTFRFEQKSQLTFSFAYAWLDAKNHLESGSVESEEEDEGDAGAEDPLDFDDLEGDFNNDVRGYSIGMKWTTPIVENLYYTALFRFNKYDQEIKGELDGGTQVFKVDERFIDMNFGVLYIF